MAVICHIRRDEHPLWKRLGLEVLVEERQVLLVGQSIWARVGIVDDRWVVLADVVVRLGPMIDVGVALVASVGHVLLIAAPADSLVLE